MLAGHDTAALQLIGRLCYERSIFVESYIVKLIIENQVLVI
jgi:hypothetical protein